MRRPRRLSLGVLRLRAYLGAGFIAAGAALGVRLLLRPEPLSAKALGLGFSLVAVLFGAVRIREFVLARAAASDAQA